MSADKNKIHKKNYSFPDIEFGLEEPSDMLLPLLSFQFHDDDGGGGKNKNIEKILTVTEIVDLIINTSQSIQRYTNRDELVKIISNIHSQNSKSSCAFDNNDFIVFKKYDEYSEDDGEGGANNFSGGYKNYNKMDLYESN